MNLVELHSSNMDFEKFYAESIPKSCLPSDYGGDLESVKDLHDRNRETLMEVQEYFLWEKRFLNFEYDGIDLKLN